MPPGFTITTEACRAYLANGKEPAELRVQVTSALRHLEDSVDRRLGDRHDPLLVSVRSGAKFSMPGMMETVLNIGLNDASVAGLARHSNDDHFAWDSYRRLIQMFGKTVLGLPGDDFEHALEQMKESAGVTTDVELPVEALRRLVDVYKSIVREGTGHEFPQDPYQQLDLAIRSVFHSWNTERARLYRRQERIPIEQLEVPSQLLDPIAHHQGNPRLQFQQPPSRPDRLLARRQRVRLGRDSRLVRPRSPHWRRPHPSLRSAAWPPSGAGRWSSCGWKPDGSTRMPTWVSSSRAALSTSMSYS